MFRKLSTVALAAAGVALIAGSPVQAQSVADFYKGRTVTLVYGFGAGGTYGRYSLTLADFLSKYIPGNPKIVAQSMPGAGGLKAANYAYNVMPKDGSSLYMPVDSLIISQLLRPNKVKFQADKFTWLAGGGIRGGISHGNTDDLGYHSVEDVVTVHDFHATMLHLLGVNHEKFTFKFQGLDFRLTGVEEAHVLKTLLA